MRGGWSKTIFTLRQHDKRYQANKIHTKGTDTFSTWKNCWKPNLSHEILDSCIWQIMFFDIERSRFTKLQLHSKTEAKASPCTAWAVLASCRTGWGGGEEVDYVPWDVCWLPGLGPLNNDDRRLLLVVVSPSFLSGRHFIGAQLHNCPPVILLSFSMEHVLVRFK